MGIEAQSAAAHTRARAPRAYVVAGAGGLLFTGVVAIASGLDFAFRNALVGVAIETAAGVIPAVIAYIFYGRARGTASLVDAVVAVSLVTLALANLGFSLAPSLVEDAPVGFQAWAPFAGQFVTALGLLYAAYARDRPVTEPRRTLARLSMAGSAALVAIAVPLALVADVLPAAVSPEPAPWETGYALPIATIQVTAMCVYLAAAYGFARRVAARPEALMVWVAVSLVLSAIAALNYFIYPSLYTEYVFTGDFLRLAAVLAFAVGAFREIESYQRRVAAAAVFEERRRLARDLHDGLAQELSYISAQSRRLKRDEGRGEEQIVAAAERALEESRLAIAALTRPVDEPLHRVLADAALSAGQRAAVEVRTDLDPAVEVAPEAREAMLRILTEAIRNAARHGRAKRVDVALRRAGRLTLSVHDDGHGFDPAAAPRPDSLGLRSMRERAAGIGGTLEIDSDATSGTTVRLILP